MQRFSAYYKKKLFTLLNELEIRCHIDSWYSFFFIIKTDRIIKYRLINNNNMDISCLNAVIGTNKKKTECLLINQSRSFHFYTISSNKNTLHIKLITSVNLKYWKKNSVDSICFSFKVFLSRFGRSNKHGLVTFIQFLKYHIFEMVCILNAYSNFFCKS